MSFKHKNLLPFTRDILTECNCGKCSHPQHKRDPDEQVINKCFTRNLQQKLER